MRCEDSVPEEIVNRRQDNDTPAVASTKAKSGHKFPAVVVIFEDNCFWVLAKDEKSIPSLQQWKEALSDIQEVLREDIGDHYYSIHWLKLTEFNLFV